MKLVIDIPEKVRTAISRMGLLRIPHDMQKSVDRAIQKGTPLPKGHRRLFDERDVYEKIRPHVNNGVLDDIMFSLTPIIIETEEEEEEEEKEWKAT